MFGSKGLFFDKSSRNFIVAQGGTPCTLAHYGLVFEHYCDNAAALRGRLDLLKVLFDFKVYLYKEVEDQNGRRVSPCDIAMANEHHQVVEFLQTGAALTQRTSAGACSIL